MRSRRFSNEQIDQAPRQAEAGTQRMHRPAVTAPNQRSAMDFMHDVLATGDKVRVFTLFDVHRRKCLSQHWFASPEEAEVEFKRWRTEYNNERPHLSSGLHSPASFGGAGVYLPRGLNPRACTSQWLKIGKSRLEYSLPVPVPGPLVDALLVRRRSLPSPAHNGDVAARDALRHRTLFGNII